MAKCKYYAKHPHIEQWAAGCTGGDVHPADILGEYCQFCGKKIKFKPGKEHPDNLSSED